MRYEHVIAAVCGEDWAIDPLKLREIMGALAYRAAGQEFTPEEIEARIGSRTPTVSAGKGVAVVPIRGTIAHRMGSMDESSGGISTERIGAMFSQAMADETVGTVLLDIDSPGGTVTGVPELADRIFNARGQGKKIVALANGMCCSGAYWLAASADEIVSIPSGMAGSIGVYTAHEDLSAALDKQGIKITLISAGKHKVEGNPFEPITDEFLAFRKAQVQENYGKFLAAVARGRGVSVADVRGGYGEGRTLYAKDAKAAGLIDRIATVEDTLGRLLGKSGAGLRADADVPALVAEVEPVAVVAVVDEASRLEAF